MSTNMNIAVAAGTVRALLAIFECTEDWNSLRREGVLDSMRELKAEIDVLYEAKLRSFDIPTTATRLQAQEHTTNHQKGK